MTGIANHHFSLQIIFTPTPHPILLAMDVLPVYHWRAAGVKVPEGGANLTQPTQFLRQRQPFVRIASVTRLVRIRVLLLRSLIGRRQYGALQVPT